MRIIKRLSAATAVCLLMAGGSSGLRASNGINENLVKDIYSHVDQAGKLLNRIVKDDSPNAVIAGLVEAKLMTDATIKELISLGGKAKLVADQLGLESEVKKVSAGCTSCFGAFKNSVKELEKAALNVNGLPLLLNLVSNQDDVLNMLANVKKKNYLGVLIALSTHLEAYEKEKVAVPPAPAIEPAGAAATAPAI